MTEAKKTNVLSTIKVSEESLESWGSDILSDWTMLDCGMVKNKQYKCKIPAHELTNVGIISLGQSDVLQRVDCFVVERDEVAGVTSYMRQMAVKTREESRNLKNFFTKVSMSNIAVEGDDFIEDDGWWKGEKHLRFGMTKSRQDIRELVTLAHDTSAGSSHDIATHEIQVKTKVTTLKLYD